MSTENTVTGSVFEVIEMDGKKIVYVELPVDAEVVYGDTVTLTVVEDKTDV